MSTFVTVVHIITCVLLVIVILIQSGKGAEISASLGGSSQTVFGSSGGANFFTTFTSWAAAIFLATSLTLTVIGKTERKSIVDNLPQAPLSAAPPATTADAKPADATAPAQNTAPAAAPTSAN
jgi:preprotein translocase subunit SecG